MPYDRDMHEFSIAQALADQVRRYAPPGRAVRGVEIRVGPLRGIEPDALTMCWDAVTHETELAGSVLTIDSLPWTISCEACGATWTSAVPFVTCECGNGRPSPAGGDDLDLVSLTVDSDEEVAGGV